MPTATPLLSKLLDALSALTQAQRILKQHVAHDAPALAHHLVPYQLEGEEHICGFVRYRLQALSRSSDLPLKDLLGLPMAVTMEDGQGGRRVVSGIVCRPEKLISDGAHTLVQLELRDALSLLRLRKNRRIFRDQSVVDITAQILGEHLQANPVLAAAFRFTTSDLHKTYPTRALSHQVGESDAAFLERLWRQEGIAWHFTFAIDEGKPVHALVLSDDVQAFKPNPAGTVRFHRADATEATDTVVAWQAWRTLAPGASQRDQFDYKNGKVSQALDPSVLDQGQDGSELARTLTDYHYDAAFLGAGRQHQQQMSRRRIQAHEFAAKGFRGESVVRQFACGTTFSLSQHHDVDAHALEDRTFTLTGLHVYARNNVRLDERLGRSLFEGWQYHAPRDEVDAGGHDGSATEAPLYYNRFECVRSHVPIVPSFDPDVDVPRIHFISAIVANENGQELDVDELGRVSVRFLFNHDETQLQSYGVNAELHDSARIRVMQPMAADGFGSTFWPRNGTEVIVGFDQGHPDKALILGSPYNGAQAPAKYAHKPSTPANAPLTGIRTKEIQGQRHNHLRFSDFAGQIGVQTASDHAATQLNQGWLGTPHDEGQSQPRGEGFELTTDAAGSLRTARAMLISAFGRLRASGQQLDRQETLAVMKECTILFEELGSYAAQHEGLSVDQQAQQEQQTKLQNWDNGSNTKPDGADGGAPMITVTAPDGLHHNTPASVVTHAGQNVDTVAVQHIQSASGGRTIVNAGQGVSTFAQSGGIKTIAHQGDHVMQSQKGDTVIQSSLDLKLSASGGKVHIMGATEITLAVSGGAYLKLAGGNVELGGPGVITLHGSDHIWGGPASGSVDLPQFSQGDLGRQPVIVRPTDGAPVGQAAYRITKGDGSVSQGQTNAQGQTAPLTGQAFEQFKVNFSGPDQA